MKFQNPSIHRSKVNGRTDRQTDRQAESNMPFQLFQSWWHKNLLLRNCFLNEADITYMFLALASTKNVFCSSQIRTLVAMATFSFHRLIMGKSENLLTDLLCSLTGDFAEMFI